MGVLNDKQTDEVPGMYTQSVFSSLKVQQTWEVEPRRDESEQLTQCISRFGSSHVEYYSQRATWSTERTS